jgi:hypothetical protein
MKFYAFLLSILFLSSCAVKEAYTKELKEKLSIDTDGEMRKLQFFTSGTIILEEILTVLSEDTSMLKTGQETAIRQSNVEFQRDVIPKMSDSLVKLTDSVLGTVGELVTAGEVIKTLNADFIKDMFISPTTHTGEVSGMTSKDAIIMNDGIVKFHPQDKFMQVNDSTMIAGTNVDGNRQLARAITGTGNNNNDMVKFAMLIVNAINQQTAALRGNLFQERGINTPLY